MKKELTLSLISVLGLLAVSLSFRQVLIVPPAGAPELKYLVPLSFAAVLLVALLALGIRRTIRNKF